MKIWSMERVQSRADYFAGGRFYGELDLQCRDDPRIEQHASSYSGASFNVGSGTSCNGLTVLCGLAQETISANFLQQFNPNASSGNNLAQIGIGLNSTGAFSAASKMNNNGSNLVVDFPPALYILAPSLGLNVLAELESSNATNANVYQGGSSQIMNLQATWRG